MKLKQFLQLDTSSRIKLFEEFFKQIKSYSHENSKIENTFRDVELEKLVETVIKNYKLDDGNCCLNSHIAHALQKMTTIQSGK